MGLFLLGLSACLDRPERIVGDEAVVEDEAVVGDSAGAENAGSEVDVAAENNANTDLSSPIELIPVDEAQEDAGNSTLQEILPPGSVTRLVPIDITIGRLQDHLDGDAQRRAVYEVVQRFLQGLVEKSIEPELLAVENAERLARFMELILESEHRPLDYRIGAVVSISPDRARIPLLLFSDIGRAEATLSVEQSEGQWYIANMAVDYTLFSVEYSDPEERFIPGYYTEP